MDNNKEILNVQTSILLAALIISGSLLYSANAIAKGSLGSGSNLAAAGSANTKVTDRKDAPTEGNGKVTVVEFSDFQCPFCKSFFDNTYSQIKTKYIDTGKITFIYRHYPLPFHQNAEIAAEAAECANREGKFWQYHDILFAKSQSDGTGLDIASLKSYAQTVGLSAQFNSCLDNHETAETIKADQAEGQRVGVTGTPTFVVNGKLVVGAQPLAVFEQAIDAALK